MAILQFEKVYNISMTCLKLNRSHPDVPLDGKWVRQVAFMHGIFTVSFFSFLYSLIAVDLKEGNFTQTCTNGIFMVVWVVVTFQYFVLLWFRDHFKTLIRVNQENFDLADSMSAEDQAVVIEYANRGRWVTKVWCYSCTLNCALFPVKSLVLTLYSLYIGQFQLVPWYDYAFPSPIEENKYTPGVFTVIFSFHIFFGTYAILMYIGFCPLGPIFILNTCAQLDLMAKHFINIFKTASCDEDIAKQITAIAKKLQHIYSEVQLINEMFKVLYELSLKASAVMIPITLYQVIDSLKRGELCLEYMAFIFTASLLCYVPCYYSDLLMEKGEDLRLAIYGSGWECHFNKSARNSLIIMLTIACRPISIRTIFRTVCLDAFAELCHLSYALFSLINAVWN